MITTFDLRMTRPNCEPVMNTAEVHTLEHLGATFLRNHETFGNKTIYFGPMGCRTGFYLLLAGDYESRDILPLLKEMFMFMAEYEDEIPGASARDCGNYLDMNLPMARYLAVNSKPRCSIRFPTSDLFTRNKKRTVYKRNRFYAYRRCSFFFCRITRFRYTNVLFSPSSASI